MTDTRELLANAAGVISILLVLFASPLVLGSYVVVQRAPALAQVAWFGALALGILTTLVAAGVALVRI